MLHEVITQLDTEYVDKLMPPGVIPRADFSEFFKMRNISEEVHKIWAENYIENRDKIRPFPPTQNGYRKATIIVGASPGIKKNWEALLDIDDKFILICTPTTLRFLLDKGVRIDYVFALEGRRHWLSDIDCDTSKLTLIASPFIYPDIIKNWKGDYWFYMIGGGGEYGELLKRDWGHLGNPEVGGGNAVSTAFLWAYKFLRSRCFVFAGTSFCFYGDDYYFDGRPQPVEDLDRWKTFTFLDGKRNVVRTTPTLFGYKMWLEMATEKAPGVEVVNSTEEGIFGVWPEPVEMRGTEVWGKIRYLPWLNVAPLAMTIKAYKEKLNGVR